MSIGDDPKDVADLAPRAADFAHNDGLLTVDARLP
jgi:hypothetical protein